MHKRSNFRLIFLLILMLPGVTIPASFTCCYQIQYQPNHNKPGITLHDGVANPYESNFPLTNPANSENDISKIQGQAINYQSQRYDFSQLEFLYDSLTLLCVQGNQNNLTFKIGNENRIDISLQQGRCQGTSLFQRTLDYINSSLE